METTSKTTKLAARDIFYFRQRNRNNIFQAVIAHFASEAANGLTKKKLASRLGKDPAQVTRWFSGPSNWTLDTISDLLLAMNHEPKFSISSIDNVPAGLATFGDGDAQSNSKVLQFNSAVMA